MKKSNCLIILSAILRTFQEISVNLREEYRFVLHIVTFGAAQSLNCSESGFDGHSPDLNQAGS